MEFWLATDQGPLRGRAPAQPNVAFFAQASLAAASALLGQEPGVELRPLALRDFRQGPVAGLYCPGYRQLLSLGRRLREAGIEVFEADIRPPAGADFALHYCASRSELLECLDAWLERHDPDAIIGWNLVQFDLPILHHPARPSDHGAYP